MQAAYPSFAPPQKNKQLKNSATLEADDDINAVFRQAAAWYCDYCDWEDLNIMNEDID